tara:strand:- start:851 stop:1045 length:195 start_codon:yes stop_codon:yes gene_type:complete
MINYVNNYEKNSLSKICNMEKVEMNDEFYSNCSVYFDELRKTGRSDDGFEDEYFFTLPVISDSR